MSLIWDYDKKDLNKSEAGRILILERQINYGVDRSEKIKLKDVKNSWNKLHLDPLKKRLFEHLLWNR